MAKPTKTRLYRTERKLTRTLRVAYPSGRGRMVLRTESDWERSLEPVAVSEDGNVSTFEVEADQPRSAHGAPPPVSLGLGLLLIDRGRALHVWSGRKRLPSRSGTPVSPARGVARAPGAGPAHLPGGGDGRCAP